MDVNGNKTKLVIGALVVLLVLAIAGSVIFIQKSIDLQVEIHKKSDELLVLNKQLSSVRVEADKKISEAQAMHNDDVQAYQEKVAAFAKQAAACEKIKRNLHL
jgi:uncharacterized protein (DUF3084 family)